MAPPLVWLLWKPRNAGPGAAARCAGGSGVAASVPRAGRGRAMCRAGDRAGVPEMPRGHCSRAMCGEAAWMREDEECAEVARERRGG